TINKWSKERDFAVKLFRKNSNSYILTQSKFRKHFAIGRNHATRSACHMLQRVMCDFRNRLAECVRRNGSHLNDGLVSYKKLNALMSISCSHLLVESI
ncbi:hypothetical protein C0J52_24452, partial [Blattella germanica]